MAEDHLLEEHRKWIGYVQPVGLLVAPAALKNRGVMPDANIAPLQAQLDELVDTDDDNQAYVRMFPDFAKQFLGWADRDIAGAPNGPDLPEDLAANLIEYGERLIPTYAVPSANGEANSWQMLIRVELGMVDLDKDVEDDGKRWIATPHARFERLLRETGVPVGLLTNGRRFRLVYAPKGETSGFANFDIVSMLEVTGRPMLSAFHMLLQTNRLFGAPEQNLPSLLAESRQYQETVSTQLAEQVLVALHDLLRGLSVADARVGGTRIVDLARQDPDHLYSGLLTALMRLVFVLFAEDRDLFPRDPVWEQNYSLAGLFKRLRDEAALYPDTMDDRYGAWAQLIALWRLIHVGGQHGSIKLIARRGRLFDPDRFPFLEGRTSAADPVQIPAVSDGAVWRILNALMMLAGERLSYRTLDVEQIGSVYQAVMGFTIELTQGRSVAIKAAKRGGAAATVNLEALLAESPAKRAEWVRQRTDRKLTAKVASSVKDAKSIDALESALSSVIDERVTPKPVGAGIPVLQPTEARRKTGSHYTPRDLTAPIVAEALRPVLERLGPEVTADQLLELKVLDPAVGSGAFLVEACRQLAERVVQAWERKGATPKIPPDEDALLHARRLVAQRCLYGVDRNVMAADLAKLSLWLATLARDHEFTFVDHAIRHGDTLVGLFQDEIARLHWLAGDDQPFAALLVRDRIAKAQAERQRIRSALDFAGEDELRPLLERADQHLSDVNLVGDAVVAAFFAAEKPKAREACRQKVVAAVGVGGTGWQESLKSDVLALRRGDKPLDVFHWEFQFPEVFLRENPGFDCIVGNPPFAGKNTIINSNRNNYLEWLQTIHDGAHGNADLVAHFFRRAYRLLRDRGCFGLIATNTICQGDTRGTGLRWIRKEGGLIYVARRRYKWPGEAAVVVSVVHIAKGGYVGAFRLNDRAAERITAYLVESGGDDDPRQLTANANSSFQGTIVLGMGFTFDDTDTKGVASPIARMQELVKTHPRNAERVFAYIGGDEVNAEPTHAHHRYVINFEDFPLRRDSALPLWEQSSAKQRKKMLTQGVVSGDYPGPVAADWPDLLQIVEERVKPIRAGDKRASYRNNWWRFAERRDDLDRSVKELDRALVINCGATPHMAFTFLPTRVVFANTLVVISKAEYSQFAILQSRVHEIWARFFGSSMKDDLRYTPTDVFETFPFPERVDTLPELEEVGRRYFQHRAAMMLATSKGMTHTYNRFNDQSDTADDIETLRALHSEMDRAVLNAYGWSDVGSEAVFEPEWNNEGSSVPIRLRWPGETRDKILAKLLELNAERARLEALLGNAAEATGHQSPSHEDFTLEIQE